MVYYNLTVNIIHCTQLTENHIDCQVQLPNSIINKDRTSLSFFWWLCHPHLRSMVSWIQRSLVLSMTLKNGWALQYQLLMRIKISWCVKKHKIVLCKFMKIIQSVWMSWKNVPGSLMIVQWFRPIFRVLRQTILQVDLHCTGMVIHIFNRYWAGDR